MTQQTPFIADRESGYQPAPDELDPAAQADDGEDPRPSLMRTPPLTPTTDPTGLVQRVRDELATDSWLAETIARHLNEMIAPNSLCEMPLSVHLALRDLARRILT